MPDLNIAPGYPFLLACVMKVLPFNFAANPSSLSAYQPESLITGFNDVLFFVATRFFCSSGSRAVCLTPRWRGLRRSYSRGERDLLEIQCGWFVNNVADPACSCASRGLWLVIEERERRRGSSLRRLDPTGLAATVGVLMGIGGLSRYSIAWLLIPVLLFIGLFCKRCRGRMILSAALSFVLVMTPWIWRNLKISDTPFGMATYSVLENTRPFEEDRVVRSVLLIHSAQAFRASRPRATFSTNSW